MLFLNLGNYHINLTYNLNILKYRIKSSIIEIDYNGDGEGYMHKDRIKQLIHQYAQEPKKYILYCMQQSQRVNFNHALEFAIEKGNQLSLPIVVCFSLISQYNHERIKLTLGGYSPIQYRLMNQQMI